MVRRVTRSGDFRSVAVGWRWVLFVAVALVAWLGPQGSARAQDSTFYLDRLYMAGAPDDTMALWRPQMGDKSRFYGQFGLGFALNPFRIENHVKDGTVAAQLDQVSGPPVATQLATYLNVGFEALDRFGFQASMPIILFQGTNSTSNSGLGLGDSVSPNAAAVMDLRLDARVIAWRNVERTVKLGFDASLWLPTGDQFSWAGDRSTSGGLFVAGEYDFKSFFITLNTGVQFRNSADVNQFQLQHEWRWGGGAFVPLRDGTLRLGAQIFGSTGIGRDTTFEGSNTPIEWLAEGRLALDQRKRAWLGVGGGTRLSAGYAPDMRLLATIGYWFPVSDSDPRSPGKKWKAERFREHGGDADKDGLPDDIDLCPTDPEDHKPPNPDDGCPALPDRDGDGIPDASDKCPDQPEDFDKIDDWDGCPEDDADKDGIPDAKDACPKEPGEPSPEPAKNGCPQFIRRISGSSEIQVLKQIEFETGSAKIRPTSFKIVDEVVRLMKVNVEIKHLDIEGHTDNKGSDDLNEKLSNDRAHSVMQYLVDHGIDAGRLAAQGFGPKRPIADNNTAEGRQKNRRVEFHIRNQNVGTGGGDKPAPETPPPGN